MKLDGSIDNEQPQVRIYVLSGSWHGEKAASMLASGWQVLMCLVDVNKSRERRVFAIWL